MKLTGVLITFLAVVVCSGLAAFWSRVRSSTTIDAASVIGAPAWIQLAPDNSAFVRTFVTEEDCPSLKADGRVLAMVARTHKGAAFPGAVCEMKISLPVQALELSGRSLAVPTSDPKRIVVIGDTGCKIKKSKVSVSSQNCNDTHAWPFAQVAAAAAAWKPDLVIHVGDYHYREANCPPNNSHCAGSTSGDNWQSWQEDFFVPANPLLAAAPWIFVRGNHELCERGGNGWFEFFDLAAANGECVDATKPYTLTVGDRTIAVVDAADDKNIQPSLDELTLPSGAKIWLLLHRPFLTSGADDETTTEPARLPEGLQDKIGVVFTGHQHHMSLNRFSDFRPPELISGNGGTELEKPGLPNPDAAAESNDFGFLTLERIDAAHWAIREHDRAGNATQECSLTEKAVGKAVLSCP